MSEGWRQTGDRPAFFMPYIFHVLPLLFWWCTFPKINGLANPWIGNDIREEEMNEWRDERLGKTDCLASFVSRFYHFILVNPKPVSWSRECVYPWHEREQRERIEKRDEWETHSREEDLRDDGMEERRAWALIHSFPSSSNPSLRSGSEERVRWRIAWQWRKWKYKQTNNIQIIRLGKALQ